MRTMETMLSRLSSICPLSDELAEHLQTIVQERKLQRKEYLLRAGHICRRVYFIGEGLLRCYYLKGDTEVHSWFLQEQEIALSVESFFRQHSSREFIQALEDCSLYSISYDQLQFIYRQFPEFNYIGRVLTEQYLLRWNRQLAGLRLQQAPDRFQWLCHEFPCLLQRVPAKYLASWIGISDVMMSRVKRRFYGRGEVG